ncbi:MAG: endonuclease/exonuclease/phosphatase family protein [Pirellulales bacterium]
MGVEDYDHRPSFANRVIRDLVWSWAVIAGLAALLRIVAHDANWPLMVANSFSLYLYLPAYVAAALLAWRRRWAVLSLCLLLAGCHIGWVAADFWPAAAVNASTDGRRLRVFSANLHIRNTNPAGILAEIRRADADLLLLQEYSPGWHRACLADGILEQFPHRLFHTQADSFGTAVYSKFEFTEQEIWTTGRIPITEVRVRLRGVNVRIINWHPLPPRSFEYFAVQNDQYADLIKRLEGEQLPTMIVGDFNITQHAFWMQRLESCGFRSAHELCGRGCAVTYPNGTNPLPPIRLDHALLSEHVECLQISEGEGRGSDHKPLLAEFLILPAAK